jgi:hypothetical protein
MPVVEAKTRNSCYFFRLMLEGAKELKIKVEEFNRKKYLLKCEVIKMPYILT